MTSKNYTETVGKDSSKRLAIRHRKFVSYSAILIAPEDMDVARKALAEKGIKCVPIECTPCLTASGNNHEEIQEKIKFTLQALEAEERTKLSPFVPAAK